ncbi:ferredoxin-type protein [Aliarcobacter faecis]|uniref:ferredoxin-type protein NapF n=1 Tax=Aliarcobacter faecis TaxID=1564138 RepID=UPI00047C15B8|nr:ferredoxin-type protein NapF [Aliarcobacter faecis]QKF74030.1 ferredoxin-type protein [Aliarcobacter faecis]
MQRRELFSSLAKPFKTKEKQETAIRPPYFKDINLFLTNCIECKTKDCEKVCEESIIKILNDGTPILDFSNSGCTYCNLCAEACKNKVLDIEYKKQIEAKIDIDVLSCLSWQSTMCFSCKDPCLDDAINFLGMFRPSINTNCTSCGFCIKVCPTNAIKVSSL